MKAPSRFLQTAVALARATGEKILRLQPPLRHARTAAGRLFSAADLIAHHFLTESLPQFYDGYPVLSGLSPPPDLAERSGWETYWLVGPLGDAEEFIRRSDEFTVTIALIHQHRPVLGVVYAPAQSVCYFAAEGCGAFKQTGSDEPRQIYVQMQSACPPAIAASGVDFGDSLEAYLRWLGQPTYARHSHTLALCHVADGQTDLAPHLMSGMEWDTAAAQCIIEAAGGAVTDLHGQPLRYNARAALAQPFFLAFGDKSHNWRPPADTLEESAMPHDHLPSPLLQAARALALQAGEKIMQIYRSDFRVAHKADNSPLTAADLAAHHCLSEGLQALPGGYPVLSEEAAELPFDERRTWETYWLIDPLDGTKEFVKRNGEFTVNIALIRQHQPVLGVVYAPALGVCYFAEAGGGAFKQDAQGDLLWLAVRKSAPARVVVAGSRSHGGAELAQYLDRLGAHELKSVGSSLKFCLIAEGTADVYPRLGPTCEWDTAAAQCVVEVAGGSVTDLDGAPLRYNCKASLLNPYFIVAGDNSRDWTAYADGLQSASRAA